MCSYAVLVFLRAMLRRYKRPSNIFGCDALRKHGRISNSFPDTVIGTVAWYFTRLSEAKKEKIEIFSHWTWFGFSPKSAAGIWTHLDCRDQFDWLLGIYIGRSTHLSSSVYIDRRLCMKWHSPKSSLTTVRGMCPSVRCPAIVRHRHVSIDRETICMVVAMRPFRVRHLCSARCYGTSRSSPLDSVAVVSANLN